MNDTTSEPDERLKDPVEVAPEPPPARRGWAPPRGGRTATLAFVALMLCGALLALWAWDLPPFRRSIQTTDNAYVRGQTTIIAPQVNGYVVAVAVRDFDAVETGAVLARIDDRIYRQRVEQARANLQSQIATLANSQQNQRSREAALGGQQAGIESARAQLARAQADMRRVDELVAEGSVSLRERDQTRAALAQAEAGVRQAEAQRTIGQQDVRAVTVGRAGLEAAVDNARAALRLAEIDLANTVIRAPQGGRLGEVSVRLGQYVTAGSQLMFLVPPEIWVSANFKEAQTARIRPGQPAIMTVDALGGAEVRGTVERLSPAAGSEFSVIRPDNATGNFVKVPQRLAVRIRLDPRDPLYRRLSPGMSVEARVDTGVDPGPARQPAR
ncbi:HlyD family secretion protein [Croceibacterium ferulae]|uniref:HlyD family secretion protein n=1 Tax=Croceibacterium ferulae TaxID=1854641 RepID=UPI000EB2B57E|nr:HlyD family secretion protein [Croceibacterium ferulae]